MDKVTRPADMNEAFARAFNSRDLDRLLALYEDDAALRTDATETTHRGRAAIARELARLLDVPGTMVSRNNFCIQHGEIALLRADHTIRDAGGAVVVEGSSAEVIRRQPDGSWRYVIDHAFGAALRRVG